MVRLSVSLPLADDSRPTEELWALCDTGADLSCLPDVLVRTLELLEVDVISVAGYDGAPETKPVYAARLQSPGLVDRIVRVVAIAHVYGIVGRDLLNSVRLQLDGPRETLTLL